MGYRQYIAEQLLESLKNEVGKPGGVLSEVEQSGEDVLTVTDVEGGVYLIELSSSTNRASIQGG